MNHLQQLSEYLQSEKFQFLNNDDGQEMENEEITSVLEPFNDPDFICFFLNFLREKSAKVLKKDDSFLLQTSEINTCENIVPAVTHKGSASGTTQMMSTPKLRNDIATPNSCHNFYTKSSNYSHTTHGTAHPKSASFNQPNFTVTFNHPQNSKSNQRYRNKPLSLSDFLSPEAGHSTNYSSTKKRPQKQRSHNKKKITPIAERQSQQYTSNSYASGNKFSPSFSEMSHNKQKASDLKRPVNPLYSEVSRSIFFGIEEEFPSLSLTSPQTITTKPTRRIKPTTLTTAKVSSVEYFEASVKDSDSHNPFVSALPVNPSSSYDLNEERNLLLNMKKKGKRQAIEEEKSLKTPIKSLDNISPVKQISSEPDPLHVFDAKKLQRLAQLYSYFINAFLIPSLISELHLIADLLTVNVSSKKQDGSALLHITGSLCNSSESNMEETEESMPSMLLMLLSTAENCVFFAVCTIHCLVQTGIISVLSRSTLSMLLQSSRIQCFMPTLPIQISALLEKLEQKEKDLSVDQYGGSQDKQLSLSCVPFQAETDDRSNFQSDKAFHAFRKHRDLFYAILREYEEKKSTNFDIQQHLGGKMRNLVSQVKSTATYKPFVRLFVSQMLQESNFVKNITQTSSFTEGSYIDDNTSRTDLLTSLKHGDPEKFRRLQSRFVTASTPSSKVSKAQDSIAEQCHFYKEFITCADSFVLNVHLCDELRDRIDDIETQQVQQILDDALAESVNLTTVSASLSNIISSAQILGRFFGFVTFLPYNTENSSITSFDPHIAKYLSSALDDASSNKHNLVTIPWVTEYLKSSNFTSISSFKEIKEVVEKLFQVFRHHAFDRANSFSSGDLMMSLVISILLEMSIFPEDTFFDLLKKYPRTKYAQNNLNLHSGAQQNKESKNDSKSSLDECCIDLINITMVYDWHPALKEIRSNIISNISSAGKSNTSHQPPRKIKPSTEKKAEETVAQKKEKQLQFNLEEYFFRGQPSSLKRTVAFVAERSASNCVKHIRSISMLAICEEAEEIFRQRLEQSNADVVGNHQRIGLTRQVTAEMNEVAKNRMSEEADKFCEKAVPQCMENLTSCETADGVLKVATAIARKRAIANAHSWLNTRLDELVTVSVKARLTKVASSLATTENRCLPKVMNAFEHKNNNLEIESLSSLLQIMKEYIAKMTFSNYSESRFYFFGPATIIPGICDGIIREDVTFLLSLSSSILNEDNGCYTNEETYNSIQKLITASPHLRNSLILVTKQLSKQAESFFGRSFFNSLASSCDQKFLNLQSTCS